MGKDADLHTEVAGQTKGGGKPMKNLMCLGNGKKGDFPQCGGLMFTLFPACARAGWSVQFGRSDEHTSELQSLMRISYAVFCLKKTNIYSSTIVQYTHSKEDH